MQSAGLPTAVLPTVAGEYLGHLYPLHNYAKVELNCLLRIHTC